MPDNDAPQSNGAGDGVLDISIVGGGPTGLFAAFYAGLRDLSCRIIDTMDDLGGQLTAMYPEKNIYDMPGFPEVVASDLVEDMAEQGLQFGAETELGQRVTDLDVNGETVTLTTDEGNEFESKTVILALGAGSVQPSKLDIPGEDEYHGNGVRNVVRDRSLYEDKDIVIVGGGDSALDWTNELYDEAASIELVHRSRFFRAHESSVRAAQEKGVPFHTDCVLEEIEGNGESVEKVKVKNRKSGEKFELECDRVLICIGFDMDLDFIEDWGIETGKRGRSITVGPNMTTNLDRVYAAGDITTHDGKLELIATAVGEATVAVNHIATRLNDKSGFFPGHSTNMEKFGGDGGPKRPVEVNPDD